MEPYIIDNEIFTYVFEIWINHVGFIMVGSLCGHLSGECLPALSANLNKNADSGVLFLYLHFKSKPIGSKTGQYAG